jgi:hypothetical protein
VAFRVEIEDRSEPGGSHRDLPSDVYRIRIWRPVGAETAESLAAGACCTNENPVFPASRSPDVDDGRNVIRGNLQIHPQLRHSAEGVCPVPSGRCAP